MTVDIVVPTNKKNYKATPVIGSTKHNVIVTGQPVSASWNRNFAMDISNADIVVMIDDDIRGFYTGWVEDLIFPLEDETICMVSGRCVDDKGEMVPVGHCCYDWKPDVIDIPKLKEGILPSSVIAFRRTHIRFDVGYVGACFEDADFCFQFYKEYPGKRFVVNNRCKLIHDNERKGYGGIGNKNKEEGKNLQINRDYFYKKWKI